MASSSVPGGMERYTRSFSARPPSITTSLALVCPTITSCFTIFIPSFLYTYVTVSAWLCRHSSGINMALSTTLAMMRLLVVMEGRSVGSVPLISTATSNTFASEFGRCSPTLATRITLPVNFLSGYASRPMVTSCPAFTLRTSTSLT